MTDLKVGDRVAVIAKGPWQCRQGTVIHAGVFVVTVRRDDGGYMWLRRTQIAKLEEPPK